MIKDLVPIIQSVFFKQICLQYKRNLFDFKMTNFSIINQFTVIPCQSAQGPDTESLGIQPMALFFYSLIPIYVLAPGHSAILEKNG